MRGSPEGADEFSPGRKPWVGEGKNQSPFRDGRKAGSSTALLIRRRIRMLARNDSFFGF